MKKKRKMDPVLTNIFETEFHYHHGNFKLLTTAPRNKRCEFVCVAKVAIKFEINFNKHHRYSI